MQVSLVARIKGFDIQGSQMQLFLQVLEKDPTEELDKLIEDRGPMELIGRLIRLTIVDLEGDVAPSE